MRNDLTMKLFVAGVLSSNPKHWSEWDEFSLVLAENKERAEMLTDKRPIRKVDMSKEALLCSLREPNYGEDI